MVNDDRLQMENSRLRLEVDRLWMEYGRHFKVEKFHTAYVR